MVYMTRYKLIAFTTLLFCSVWVSAQSQPSGSENAWKEAVNRSDFMKIDQFLRQGMNPDIPGDEGVTALMQAASANNTSLIKFIISKGAHLDSSSAGEYTALMWAASKGRTEAVALLMEKGASCGAVNSNGKTAYDLAQANKHNASAALLKNCGTAKKTNPRGIILGTVVNIREKPDTKASVLCQMQQNDYVTIIEWTAVEEKISVNHDRWVRVMTGDGVKGYMFGAYLFDLQKFCDRSWHLESCSGASKSIRFFSDTRFELTEGCSEPECGPPSVTARGTFSLDGRNILFHGSVPESYRDGLYIYRLNGRNTLYSSLREIDDHEFMKDIGNCGLWYQSEDR
jgi:hypothetical protein